MVEVAPLYDSAPSAILFNSSLAEVIDEKLMKNAFAHNLFCHLVVQQYLPDFPVSSSLSLFVGADVRLTQPADFQ